MTTTSSILILAAAALIAGVLLSLHLQFSRKPGRLAVVGLATFLIMGCAALGAALAN